MKKILIYLAIIFTNLYPEKVTLPPAYYLDISNYTWKGPARITINNNKISEISLVAKKKETVYYITPTFCDAQVTLSLNSLGGVNNKNDIHEILQNYIQHGVTHILSTFDPPWVSDYYNELKTKNRKLPIVYFSQKPILYSTKEYEELPKEIYFYSENFSELQKELHRQRNGNLPILIIHRHFPDNLHYFTSESLYLLKKSSKNKILSVATFANKQSTLDALRAEFEYIHHPISAEWENEIQFEHKKNLKLLPLLNVYRNLFLIQNKMIESEWEKLNSISNYFQKKIFEKAKESTSYITEIEEQVPFEEYKKFIFNNQNIQKNLVLGSGAGNLFSFHVISTLQELNLFREILHTNEFLKAGVENSCKYMGVNDNRAIQVGNPVSLILFKNNPTQSFKNLFSIEKVFH